MKRILVIDDEESIRQVIVEALSMRGWHLLEAPDGEEGLKRAGQDLPDMILCDIQMPKLDGYSVLRGVRQIDALATTPFLFLTGHGDKPMMRQAMELGADDFIVKPFTVPELIAAVEARFQKVAVIEETADKKLEALRDSLRFALPHELVTPLNTILGFAGLLLDNPAAGSEQISEFAREIRGAGDRLRALIEKFLFYAQIELAVADEEQRAAFAGRTATATEEIISGIAQRVAAEQNRPEDLVLSIAPLDHAISPPHLERLVRELVENGFKFSRAGQPVRVIAGVRENRFRLQVRDQGVGFTPDQIRQVSANIQFNRKMSEQQGTGLGLAITRKIAELYRGELNLESKPGEITTATVQLPA
jgi:two-component system sensor histidine kinase/response regulator